jgi:glycerol uptake facilitator protein
MTEIIGTFVLVFGILAFFAEAGTTDTHLGGLIVGLLVLAIGLSLGGPTGYAINPARDLGPRLFAGLAGWGEVAIPGNYANVSGYLWIPIVGPFVGGVIGAFVYDLGIRDTLRARGEQAPPDVEQRGRTVEELD